MLNNIIDLSPERNYSDEEMLINDSKCDGSTKITEDRSIQKQSFQVQQNEFDHQFLSDSYRQRQLINEFEIELPQGQKQEEIQKECINESFQMNQELMTSQRMSVRNIITPELFGESQPKHTHNLKNKVINQNQEGVTVVNNNLVNNIHQQQIFAPFGKDQSILSFEEMKKAQKKPLPKWDHKIKGQSKNTESSHFQEIKKVNDIPKRNTSNIENIKPSNKYPHIESKVRLALKQNVNNNSLVMKKVYNPSKSQKRFSDLNISEIDTKQTKAGSQKVEDISIIQDLIELDFSTMINQINQKKDFLLDKIKSISKNTQQKINNQPTKCGSIFRNRVKQNVEVDLIDLYSNMLHQKSQKNTSFNSKLTQNEQNTHELQPKQQRQRSYSIVNQESPQTISPLKIQRREPGKISRSHNSVKKVNDDTVKQLEFKYDSVINYALEIQKQLQQFKGSTNNQQTI